VNGPFETERQARAAAHAIVAPEDGWSILHRDQNRLLLERACNAAGVELGAFDRRILDWLSGFEDSSCSVLAGLIARAAEGAVKGSDSDAGADRCANCGGELDGPFPDPYDGETPRWRHLGETSFGREVARFLDADHGAEPRQDGAL